MTIAYVGNFSQAHCTEVHLAATLEMLGHEVIRLQENEIHPDTLSGMIAANPWDLFLFTRTWGELVTLRHLEQLRERQIPSASYHLDLYIGLTRKWQFGGRGIDDMLQNDPFWRTDFVFTPDGDPESQRIFQANGINHHYIKPGVFAPECYMAEREQELPVLFVGGGDRIGSPHIYGHPEWNYRNELITWLYDTYGERFAKFGHPQPTIRNAALNQLYANADITIGDSVNLTWENGAKHTHYWSDRVYETLGRGGFLIHPYIKGLEEEFIDKHHLVFYEYGNFEQLKELIDYYLANPEEREQIRKAGHEFVKNHATYTHRLKQALDIIGLEPAAMVPTPKAADPAPIKISLGAGTEIEPTGEGWINVDLLPLEGINVVHDLNVFPYPFDDESADYIKAKDLIEHLIPRLGKPTIIAFIEECHRILKPHGKLWIQTPSWEADFLWIDPTHIRGFDIRSMDFFDPDTDFGRSTGFYSGAGFKVSATMTDNKNLIFEMRKR